MSSSTFPLSSRGRDQSGEPPTSVADVREWCSESEVERSECHPFAIADKDDDEEVVVVEERCEERTPNDEQEEEAHEEEENEKEAEEEEKEEEACEEASPSTQATKAFSSLSMASCEKRGTSGTS